MNTRSKSSLPTATTLSANPGAVVRHKPREGSVCRQLSFPTRWSAILADLWPASPEPAILPRGAEPSGPPRCGLGLVVQPLSCSVSGARRSCSGWTWTGPAASPAAPATPNARCWITSRPTSTSPAAGCCRTACYATPSTSPVPTGHRLFLPPARCHRDRAVLRGHPPPRGACQDRLRQRRGPIPPGLVATAHPPTRRCGQNATPGRLRAPVQRAYRTLRSAPNVSHAPTLQPPRRTAAHVRHVAQKATTQRDGRAASLRRTGRRRASAGRAAGDWWFCPAVGVCLPGSGPSPWTPSPRARSCSPGSPATLTSPGW